MANYVEGELPNKEFVMEFEGKSREILYYSNLDLENIVTPVNADILEELLTVSDYNERKKNKLIKGFRQGFDLGYRGPTKVNQTAPNLKLTVGDELVLWNKVMKEVKAKRYAGPFLIDRPPFSHYIQSPIGLVPKDGGKETRLIFHLSYPRNGSTSVNANTPKSKTKVKYPDFSEAVKLCLKEGNSCSISRSDLQAAFRNLGILRKQWRFLLMKARDPISKRWFLFLDKCLPFGSAASCKIFQEFSDCLAHLVQFRTAAGKKVTNYLDDFLFVAFVRWLCNLQCQNFLDICREINFPVAIDKTFWDSTKMVFLGFLLDTVEQRVGIPLEKITKGVNMIDYILGKTRITLYELQRICGYLNFLSKCVIPGRTFTLRLYSKINPKMKRHHHLRVSKEMRFDLQVWLAFLNHPSVFSRPFMDYSLMTANELMFYTDASANPRLGFGGFFNGDYMWQQWDEDFIKSYNPGIAYLELYAVTAALIAWMPKFQNRRVAVFVDNKNVKSYLNNMSSGCKNIMVLVRLLVLEQMVNNVRVYGCYVKSSENIGADDLFRLRIDKFKTDMAKKGIKLEERTEVPENIWPMNKVWIN